MAQGRLIFVQVRFIEVHQGFAKQRSDTFLTDLVFIQKLVKYLLIYII